MKARITFALSMFLLCAVSFGDAADTVSCPERIVTSQELKSNVAGWTAILDDTPQSLSGITFYDGPPAEKASLVYDQIRHSKGEDVATWTFAKQEDRRTYLVCSYAGTAVELSRALPPQITTCTVNYDTQQHIAGQPVIKRVSCH